MERITRVNFKRPRKFSAYNYKQWLNNFMDLNNWSQNKGRPFDSDKNLGRRSIEYINSCLTYVVPDYKTASLEEIKKAAIKRNSPRVSKKVVSTHLETLDIEQYLYYCNSSYTDIPLFCIDLDQLVDEETGEILTTAEDLKEAEEYISKVLSSYYAEPSTRKKGLHYYFHIDFTECWLEVFTDLFKFDHYADLVNHYITELSHILKEQVNSRFKVHFDAIKGTMSRYICKNSKYSIIDKSGVFCKLPIPHNQNEFDLLMNLTPIPCKEIYSYITKTTDSDSFSSPKKNVISDIESEDNSNKKKRNTTVCGDFLVSTQEKNLKNNEIEDTNSKSYYSNDVMFRSREVGIIYFKNYWKEYNRLPSCQEYRTYYRDTAGTGPETQENKERLEQVYEWLVKWFDPSKMQNSLYSVGEHIPFLIADDISDERIDLIRKAHTKYKKKIRLIDLDLMLGHFFTLLMSNKEDKQMKWKSLTCPTKAIPLFFQSQKEHFRGKKVKGYKIPTCDNCKAKSIKIILENLGYLSCIDQSYSTRTHTAKRWLLTEKFSRYKDLENYLGRDFIQSFTAAPKIRTA